MGRRSFTDAAKSANFEDLAGVALSAVTIDGDVSSARLTVNNGETAYTFTGTGALVDGANPMSGAAYFDTWQWFNLSNTYFACTSFSYVLLRLNHCHVSKYAAPDIGFAPSTRAPVPVNV